MANFKKLKDGEGNVYLVKDETARTNLSSHTSNTSNPHSVTKAQVGLGNVDNTSDANKPISNAQATVNATIFNKANVKSSPSSPTSDENVLSEKYSEDHYVKHNTYDGTLSVKKADYADLANNLDSNLIMVDKTPYLFRTSGGSLEIANTNRVKKIIGGSLPIIQNARSLTSNDWQVEDDSKCSVSFNNGEATCTLLQGGTGYSYGIHNESARNGKGHTWLLSFEAKSSSGINIGYDAFNSAGNLGATTTSYKLFSVIAEFNNAGYFYICPRAGEVTPQANDTFSVRKVQLIDLTQTFGPTVANRLYTLEQAQAGTGIAKAKEILVKDYYQYNVSTFTHVKTSGKVNTGFNLLNLSKWLSDNGFTNPAACNNSTFSSKVLWQNDINYQGRVCVYHSGITRSNSEFVVIKFYYTDGSDDIMYADGKLHNDGYTKSAESKIVKYVGFTYSSLGTQNFTNAKMCVSLSWDGERDGEYEPYQEWSYPTEDIELKGIISLNASDEWVYDGDEYNYDGTVSDRIIIIPDLSQLEWGKETGSLFYCTSAIMPLNLYSRNGLCSKYAKSSSSQYGPAENKTWGKSGAGYFEILDTDYTDVTTFKNSLSGVWLIGVVAEPTTTEADPFQEQQNLSNWGTEKWVDDREVPLPVASYTEYLPDLKAKLEVVAESPSEDGTYVMVRSDGQNAYGLLSSWLSDNDYVKQVDLSSEITDVAGLTYINKKAYRTGNVVTLDIIARNGTESAISAGSVLFTLGEHLRPLDNLYPIVLNYTTIEYLSIYSSNGNVLNTTDIGTSKSIYITVSYAVA